MKFIHLSDLHIGKRVNAFSMLEDQKYILKQILEIIQKEKPDAVILAGDIYDKPQPSAEAVQVLDQFLTLLFQEQVNIFMISGNHDSAERVSFGNQIFKASKLYVAPIYHGQIEPIAMKDSYGEIKIWMLPFIKPATVKHALQLEEKQSLTYEEAVASAIHQCEINKKERNIIISHQFVTGALRSDSEDIVVGGLDQVSADVFKDFDYVALGHIHRPQNIGKDTVRYCGTPLKYSFSECSVEKSVTCVEMREKGSVEVRTIPLKPLHDMRKIRGTYLEVTARDFYKDSDVYDYLQVTLTDEEDIPNALEKLRTIYPNLMNLAYDNQRTRANHAFDQVEANIRKSELELFEEFYQLQNNGPWNEEQKMYAEALIQRVKERER